MKYYNDRTERGGFIARISADGVCEYFDKGSQTWVEDEDLSFDIEFTGDYEPISEATALARTRRLATTA